MRTVLLALLVLGGCAEAVPVGDLDLVAVRSNQIEVDSATAAIEQLVLGPCAGEVQSVWVGYRMNLLRPEPLPVPVDSYCDVGLEFATDPFDGSLRLSGTTAAGTPFRIALDPGLATREREFAYLVDTESILALDMALLFSDDAVDAIDAMEPPVDLGPDAPLAETLAERVGDALVFFETPQAARAFYVDLWPDVDLSIRASVDVSGCNVDGPLIYVPPDDSESTPVSEPEPNEPGTDPPPPNSSSGCGDGGCSGGDGSSPGCDCGGGCDAQCATGGFAPVASLAIVGFISLRRRRTSLLGEATAPEASHTLRG